MKSIILLSMFIFSCSTGGKEQVEDFINEYENVVNKYETKFNNSELTNTDIAEMNSANIELTNESIKLKGFISWSDQQLNRYNEISSRFTKILLITNKSSINKQADYFLNKYDEFIINLETKLDNSELSISNISELEKSNMDLLNEINKFNNASEDWSIEQLNRYNYILMRFSKVIFSINNITLQDYNGAMDELVKVSNEFEEYKNNIKPEIK